MNDPEIDNNTVGVALLVSNDYESLPKVGNLSSIHQDADKLGELFKIFGYVVYKIQNISYRDFSSCCNTLSRFNYPSTCTRIIVYFSGHGDDGSLLMNDGEEVDIDDIITAFKPFAAGNPKLGLIARMFFFDACRGGKEDHGYWITKKDKPPSEITCLARIPHEGNILVAYASTRYFSAFVGPDGSNWSNCFIEAMEKSKETDSIENILTSANGIMSHKEVKGCVQTAMFNSTLRSGVCFKQEGNHRADSGQYYAPRSLAINHATDTTVTLSWMVPRMSNGAITGYQLEYRPTGDESYSSQALSLLTGTVTGLSPSTEYQFRVAAVTVSGRGPYSDTVYCSTIVLGPRPLATELVNVVTSNYDEQWREIGTSLGITVPELDSIGHDHKHSAKNRLSKLWEKWLNKDGTASWDKLVKALDDITLKSEPFDREAAVQHLWDNTSTLTSIQYDTIKYNLYARGIISHSERKLIDRMPTNTEKMLALLDIIQGSLRAGYTEKFNAFMKALEESNDSKYIEIAKKIDGKISS